jgi:Putative phage metallopeptidase
MARLRKTPRKPRAKVVRVQFVPRPERKPKKPDPDCPYGYLDDLVEKQIHRHLDQAKIAIAWMLDVKADKDGHLVLGKCKKATDLDREFREFDFVILLNSRAWKSLKENQRAALVDHELHHAGVVVDKNGEPVYDERSRKCYRIKKHDIEEFHAVVKDHGLYKHDLESFARACQQSPLFKDEVNGQAPASEPESNDKPEFTPGPDPQDETWKATPLDEALPDLPKKFYELCEKQGLDTIGKLFAWKNERADRWWKDLGKGVGQATFDKLDDAIEAFWMTRPVAETAS